MTDTNTAKLVGQLRILHQLTNTEIQIAQTRLAQARNDTVRQQFTTNAANAQERAGLIAAALRELGGVPDVVTPALGRAAALAKAVFEQGQPIAAALFGDLALEHQLLDRATYLEVLAHATEDVDTQLLARRLQAAHHETIEWINSVLAQEAAGKVTAVRPTPVQTAVGRITRAANYPSRWTAARINAAAEAVARTRSRVATVTDAAVDSLTTGRDAGLQQAEQIATRRGASSIASALHRTRVFAGGLSEDELPIANYDDLTVDEVESEVQGLTDSGALAALLRYEQNHKDRAGASTAINNQLVAVKAQESARN
ncbi:ferritin-like domain-containing protein [Mycobacterium sp. Aquia_213]|uniref:ferritin-like domain-containing protein n=1 Tax=Mycobacterium sp. Aquia_213 TaxID=2991728 RepID=UPI00226EFC63|nr:ferritin-like domain-containing protein [Mycobacterium sp. Aquia_213]WAC93688.1 ferritin-like domain-containing protein [Mycobacterium sp. Aquia_213]